MARLTPAELRSRLALDYRALAGLTREAIGRIDAYASVSTLAQQAPLSPSAATSGQATAYLVEYCFTHLVGRGQTAATAKAVFDLGSGGNYPFSAPAVAFVSRPVPWTPHVHPTSGIVCLGSGWVHSGGQMLLAQLVVHVMRLMNFDEPRASVDAQWNASADAYWHSNLRRGPFLPELRYPRLPIEVTHAVPDESTGFRAAGTVRFAGATYDTRVFRHAGDEA